MIEHRTRRWGTLVGGGIGCLLAVTPVMACQIPVFRYALERWEPDAYEVTVFHRGPLEAAAKARVETLRAAATALEAGALDAPQGGFTHMTVELVDLAESGVPGAGKPDDVGNRGFRALEDRFGETTLPAAVVHYPRKVGLAEPVWFGSLTEVSIARLLDSPVRREISKRILAGDSVVWVLVESGKASADDAAYKELVEVLATLERRLQLPDMESIVNDEEYRGETQVELKLSFSALRLERGAVEEELFLAMLMGIEADLKDFAAEPIAIPVFGRGRALYGLTGKGINEDTVESACRNLVGPCSCTVKELNPGVDLLFSVDWNNLVTGDAAPQKDLPQLPVMAVVDSDPGNGDPGDGDAGDVTESDLAESAKLTASSADGAVETARLPDRSPGESTAVVVAENRQAAVSYTKEGETGDGATEKVGGTGVSASEGATVSTEQSEETLVLPVAVVLAGGLLVVLVGSFLMLRSGAR